MRGIELDWPSTGCAGPPLCPVRATPIAMAGSRRRFPYEFNVSRHTMSTDKSRFMV
jgi:hypothetical protein